MHPSPAAGDREDSLTEGLALRDRIGRVVDPTDAEPARRRVEEEPMTTRFFVVIGDDESAGPERGPRPSGARTDKR